MSRYKSGDKVKYKEIYISGESEVFTVVKYRKYYKMTEYTLESDKGERHDCYYPNQLQLVKRRFT